MQPIANYFNSPVQLYISCEISLAWALENRASEDDAHRNGVGLAEVALLNMVRSVLTLKTILSSIFL